jgi:hypothetical protein
MLSWINKITHAHAFEFLDDFYSNKFPEFDPLMSTHASVLVDSVGPPSAEVCRAAASFP